MVLAVALAEALTVTTAYIKVLLAVVLDVLVGTTTGAGLLL